MRREPDTAWVMVLLLLLAYVAILVNIELAFR